MTPRVRALAATFIACGSLGVVSGCDVGQGPETGIGEPIQVSGGQFIPGALPGSPSLPGDGGVAAPDAAPSPLSVLDVTFASTQIVAGIAGKSFGGDVSSDAVAVGVRIAGEGTGYWVVPVGSPDLQIANAYTFSMSTSFEANDPPGLRDLQFVALGPSGAGGMQSDLQVCFDWRIPDNGHACDPSIAPPKAVFSLQWDTNFDLDLHVQTPSGLEYTPENRLGEPLEAGVLRSIPPDLPFIDRDSLGSCVPDGLRQEDLVFPDALPSGIYHVYVDPYAACGQNAVHFTFTLYESSGTCPNCNLHVVGTPRSGELLASQVTGGSGPALFVQDVDVE
jgi:hypothetical protein